MDVISIKSMIEKKLILKYDVPLKNQIKKEFYVIDWRTIAPGCTDEVIKNSFKSLGKKIENESVIRKIENTIDFIKS